MAGQVGATSPGGFISGREIITASAFQFYSNLVLIEVGLQIATVPELSALVFALTPLRTMTIKTAARRCACLIGGPAYHSLASEARSTGGDPSFRGRRAATNGQPRRAPRQP